MIAQALLVVQEGSTELARAALSPRCLHTPFLQHPLCRPPWEALGCLTDGYVCTLNLAQPSKPAQGPCHPSGKTVQVALRPTCLSRSHH